MRKLTFLSIEYFLKVAETLNFTVAARELYISQPALSKQIKQLEEEIGVRLFRRDTKQVELTAGGQILYDEWSKLIKSSENAIGAAKSIEGKHTHKIRVGIAEFNGLIAYIAPILEFSSLLTAHSTSLSCSLSFSPSIAKVNSADSPAITFAVFGVNSNFVISL